MKNNSPEDFDSALRRDAALARQRATPSPDLASRIAREVHRSRIPESAPPARSSWRLPLLSFAGLAACAALAVLLLRPDAASTSLSRPVPLPDDPVASTRSIDTGTRAPSEIWADIQPEARALLAQDPLQTEVDAVVSDARSAIHFLALNFLPSATAEGSRPRNG